MKYPKSTFVRSRTLLFIILLTSVSAYAQKQQFKVDKKEFKFTKVDGVVETVCYASDISKDLRIPAKKGLIGNTSRIKSSTINVDYQGFEGTEGELAKTAFQAAVDIWEFQIVSDIPINVTAVWDTGLEEGVLGSAVTGNFIINPADEITPKFGMIYPIALAEKLARQPLNDPSDIDILARFNANRADWYFGIDMNPAPDEFDFLTVVLHEIGHGLGFSGAVSENAGTAAIGIENPTAPGEFINFAWTSNYFLKETGRNLVEDVANNSTAMFSAITGDDLFFSTDVREVKMFAPSFFEQGQSVFHLDESLSNGDDALMTPFINKGEVIHQTGIALDMLNDLGWSFTWIDHEAITGSEVLDEDIPVIANIPSDEGVRDDSVFVNYRRVNLETGDDIESRIALTRTPGTDEFTGSLPATGQQTAFIYHIEAWDSLGRQFTNPGQPEEFNNLGGYLFFTEEAPPTIEHLPVTYVTEKSDSVFFIALIEDGGAGVDSAYLSYSVNGADQEPLKFILVNSDFGIYVTALDIRNFNVGDNIAYSITAVDLSQPGKTSTNPSGVDYEFEILPDPAGTEVSELLLDFNDASQASRFSSYSFSVSTPAGFSDGNFHTKNPYEAGQQDLYYVSVLTTPITLKANNEAFLEFDEIVLVEPGDASGFWDFVTVEGSKDGGDTWITFGEEYDASAESDWLAAWSSSTDGQNNSTAVGTPSLFRPRSINLTQPAEFNPGDNILIRFILYSDELVTGWGWAIDNLNIQSGITGIEEYLSEEGLKIYPNPSTDIFNIDLQLDKAVQQGAITVYNVLGKPVIRQEFQPVGSTISQALDLSANPPGVYLIDIDLDDETVTRRVVKR